MAIDYRELARRFSYTEHAERADRYFSRITVDSAVARKPFAAPAEAAEILGGLPVLLHSMYLFKGARVLDFGSGTCWLSRELAKLGASVTAVDVSAQALAIGRHLISGDPVSAHLDVNYVQLKESRLPFEDGYFDRVVCFDAFHHVPDQNFSIREFARVLKDGGLAVFHEAGPSHSQSVQSQYEMREYGVIEGDIRVEELSREARAAGFTKVEMAVYASQPVITNLDEFNRFMSGSRTSVGEQMSRQAISEMANRRTFFLHKGDVIGHLDSRSGIGLSAQLSLGARADEAGVKIEGRIFNTGAVSWLPSMGPVGAVNIGVHLVGTHEALQNSDFARYSVADDATRPGDVRTVAFVIPYPEGCDEFTFVIDLVAEGVGWFELFGVEPMKVRCVRDATTGKFVIASSIE